MKRLNEIGRQCPNTCEFACLNARQEFDLWVYQVDERYEFAAELIRLWCAEKFKTVRAVTWPDLPKSLRLKGYSSAAVFTDETLAAELRVQSKEGLRKIDNAAVLVVELTIQSQSIEGDMKQAFNGIHDTTLATFLALTTKEAQDAWNRC